MENLLLYFLKANGLIILFYLMYVIFLRKETFFTSNRWYLIGGLVLSLILPLITFTKTIWVEPTPIPVIYEELIPINNNAIKAPTQETSLDWSLIITTTYIAISILLILKITFELASFFNRIRKNRKQKETNFVLIHSDTTENPFSFFHYIVINPNRFSKEEFQHILTHESIHVKQKHSIDVLLAKLFCALFWANPIVWLYRKAILQNLEFIADNETFQQIENKYEYQRTLLKVVTHQHDLSITNQFYQSLIKKRIVMLHTNQSHKRKAWKYGIILPLLVGFMLLFQIETVAQVKEVVTNEITKSEEKVSVIITPKMSNENLKQIEKIFSDSDLTLKISNLKRDKNDALTAIKIIFKTKSGEIKEYKIDRSIPIETIELYKSNNRDNEDYFGFKKLSETPTYKFTEADTEEIAIVGKAQNSNDKNSWTVDDMVKNGKKVKMIINGKLQSENEKIKIPLDQELDVLKELDEKELKSKYNIDKKEGEIYFEFTTKKEEEKVANTSWGISYQVGPPSTEKFVEDLVKEQNIDLSKAKIIFNGVEYKQSELNNIDYKDLKNINITINKSKSKTKNDIIILETKNEDLKPFEYKKISSDKPKPRVITIKNGDNVVVFDGDKIKFPGYPTHFLNQLKLELKGKILEDNIDFFKNYEFEKIKDLIIIEDETSPKEKKKIKKIIIETK
ncbi:M56 family metallopeptidase [Flavobacterium cucumis]|uniref:Signal transducer regulating beta-lactamase production, contains metallopeptidase domain n=1 Tax=Flavobacterium cucumis TaxID=416016 RepID=A0A1M7ZYB6_9FLAO|nr:M56 family metallopeptidase [Flavobacterium cucumis]SHO73865.1 Signal transducer regulating beta-lactamase production, contains metallopeptidase domain [Flavobacterium cucumis]